MEKKMTLDRLAQLTEERIQGVEKMMATKEELRKTKDVVVEVLAFVKSIDQGVKDMKSSLVSGGYLYASVLHCSIFAFTVAYKI